MKNLLLYGTTNYGEQLSTSDLNKFKELSQEFNIYIISQNKFENIENKYVNIYYIKKSNNRYLNYLKFYFLNFVKFYKIVKSKEIDIVSAKDPISALIPVIVRKVTKLHYKLIIEHHGNYLNLLLNQRKFYFTKTITTFSKSIAKFSYKNCDFIRGVHELEVKRIAKKYNKEFSIFPAWVDYKTFYATDEKRLRKDLLFIGNVIPRKGVLFLLQAYNKFIETFNYRGKFLIVGDHPNEEYLNKCLNYTNDNNLRNVSFIGKKTPEEIANLMNNSAVLLMASSFEGLPRVLIESGLCKLPSISSDIDGISTPFGTDGGTMLYEHERIDKLVSSLRVFFQNDEIQIQLGKDSFELANKLAGKGKFLYNWKNIERSFYEE
jgi:glycosyltransferase involved in cell wall biosynthesis